MKNSLNNWWAAGLAAVFGGIGWLAKDINLNGVSGAQEPAALGGLTIVGVLGLAWTIFSRWKSAGGKLDGKMSPEEFKALADSLLERLAPQLVPIVDKIAPTASTAINQIVGPSATKLIDELSKWFGDSTPDPNESVLNHKLLDILAEAVKGNEAGAAAAATLRAALHNATPIPTVVTVA